MENLEERLQRLEGQLLAHRTLLKVYVRSESGVASGIEKSLPAMRISAPWSTLPDAVRDAAFAEIALMVAT